MGGRHGGVRRQEDEILAASRDLSPASRDWLNTGRGEEPLNPVLIGELRTVVENLRRAALTIKS